MYVLHSLKICAIWKLLKVLHILKISNICNGLHNVIVYTTCLHKTGCQKLSNRRFCYKQKNVWCNKMNIKFISGVWISSAHLSIAAIQNQLETREQTCALVLNVLPKTANTTQKYGLLPHSSKFSRWNPCPNQQVLGSQNRVCLVLSWSRSDTCSLQLLKVTLQLDLVVQWNLYNPDTCRPGKSVLIMEVSWFPRLD